jgi:polyisoprenoid-binding protein YceI
MAEPDVNGSIMRAPPGAFVLVTVIAVILPARSSARQVSDRSAKGSTPAVAAMGHAVYKIDPASSRVSIHVGKAGALSFIAGHTHEIGGPIRDGSVDVDLEAPSRSHVRLSIASSDLTVSTAGEPEGDAAKVQEAMQGEQVLDVQRYARISYESVSVALKTRHDSHLELGVTGNLTIREVTQSVVVPVQVELDGNELSARGRFEVKQSAFGIKPISVGGVVSVKDTIAIDFSIVGMHEDLHADSDSPREARRLPALPLGAR